MKTTRVYLNGGYYYVEQQYNERFTIYHLSGRKAVRISGADTLHEAVQEFDLSRNCQDDIYQRFEDAYQRELNEIYESEDDDVLSELYNNFIENLSGEDYFDIIKDGSYHAYIDWAEIEEEEEEEDIWQD